MLVLKLTPDPDADVKFGGKDPRRGVDVDDGGDFERCTVVAEEDEDATPRTDGGGLDVGVFVSPHGRSGSPEPL